MKGVFAQAVWLVLRSLEPFFTWVWDDLRGPQVQLWPMTTAGLFRLMAACAGLLCLADLWFHEHATFHSLLAWSVAVAALLSICILICLRNYRVALVFSVLLALYNPIFPVVYSIFISSNPWKRTVYDVGAALILLVPASRLSPALTYRAITEDEAARLRCESLKAEALIKEDELGRHPVRTEQEQAEQRRFKAEREWNTAGQRMFDTDEPRKTPYAVLQVRETDTLETIQANYRKLAGRSRPNRGRSSSVLSRMETNYHMEWINLAYEWLLKHHRKQ